MRVYIWVPLFFPLLIGGCASDQHDLSEEIVPYKYATTYTFPRWRYLHKLNRDPIESDAHRAWVDLYTNDKAKRAYENRSSSFPEGSIVLKPLFTDEKRSSIARLVIMMKMEKGYDTEHGDWWYGVYDETGTQGWYSGKIASCIKCHQHAKSTDYMFSEIVMEEIERQSSAR